MHYERAYLDVCHYICHRGSSSKCKHDSSLAPSQHHLGVQALLPEQLKICEGWKMHSTSFLDAATRVLNLHILKWPFCRAELRIAGAKMPAFLNNSRRFCRYAELSPEMSLSSLNEIYLTAFFCFFLLSLQKIQALRLQMTALCKICHKPTLSTL